MTELVFILDCSFSMKRMASDVIGGFNSVIKRQKEETDGKALVSTILFDRESFVLHDQIPLSKIELLTEEKYDAYGFSTALLDAIGNAIKHIEKIHCYIRKYDLPLPKTLFVIITDGIDNTSHKFHYNEIKWFIEKKKRRGWEFLFLGANIDTIKTAGNIGIDAERAVNYHADSRGTQEAFGAIGNFACAFSAAPTMHFDNFFDDNQWRNSVDKDFFDRIKK